MWRGAVSGARPGDLVLGLWRAVEVNGIYCENDAWWFVIDGCTG